MTSSISSRASMPRKASSRLAQLYADSRTNSATALARDTPALMRTSRKLSTALRAAISAFVRCRSSSRGTFSRCARTPIAASRRSRSPPCHVPCASYWPSSKWRSSRLTAFRSFLSVASMFTLLLPCLAIQRERSERWLLEQVKPP